MNHRARIYLAGGEVVTVILLGSKQDIEDDISEVLNGRGWGQIGDVFIHPGSINAIEMDEYGGAE